MACFDLDQLDLPVAYSNSALHSAVSSQYYRRDTLFSYAMARGAVSPMQPPDSPRMSESPPPSGVQGDLELELLGLANALYNLGTTVVNDLTKEKDKPGGGGKQVGMRV